MARTVDYWKQTILTAIQSDAAIKDIMNSTSKVAIYNLIAYAVAYCAWTLDMLFDFHRSDVDKALNTQRPIKLAWYREKALRFRYGQALIEETDTYDNTGLSDSDIEDREIIKYAAADLADDESRIIIKVAGENSGELQPITTIQYNSLVNYFERIRNAGDKFTIINYLPDKLNLYMTVFYDPLIIGPDGTNILNGGKPLEDGIKEYLRELPFNGELILLNLIDKLQSIEGIVIPNIDNASQRKINPDVGDYGTESYFSIRIIPRSGYFKLDTLNVDYKPNV